MNESKHKLIIEFFKKVQNPDYKYETPHKSFQPAKRINLSNNTMLDNSEKNSQEISPIPVRKYIIFQKKKENPIRYLICKKTQ